MASHLVVLKKDKECKGSIRYATEEKSDDGGEPVITNAYVMRNRLGPHPPAEVSVVVSWDE